MERPNEQAGVGLQPQPQTGDACQGYRRHATALAAWAMLRLVNRTDVWGGYLPMALRIDGALIVTKPRLTLCGKVALAERVLRNHFCGSDVRYVAGLHAISATDTCRWIGIDIDRHGDADDPQRNWDAVLLWFDKLVTLGFEPLLFDSDGQGGYHLWAIFSGPVPADLAYRFARWIVRDYKTVGLSKPPETFPRQAGGVQYGNWLRLPGRHHTREHWARVWDG